MPSDAPLAERIAQSPLLIDQNAEALFRASINHIVTHERAEALMSMSEDDDFWPTDKADWRSSLRPYNVKNGILQIPVMGVLLNRFSYQFGRWATGYTYIEKAFQRGIADANVKAIAFIHDSPGGEVAGNFELNDKIYEARGQKPMRAFAADHSYSASYSLASAADSISVTRSGGVGSIGVVTAHVDVSAAMEKHGMKITFIFAGKHKVDGNPYEALPKAVKERIQDRIDKTYAVFTGAVARNRGLDEKDVRATEALTYEATDAIKVKLADRVGAFEDEMAIFAADIEAGDEQMADTTVKAEDHTRLVAEARDAGKAEGLAEGKTAGATAAKTRISAILDSEAGKKRPKAALSAALDTDMTAEQAATFLSKLAEEKAETPAPKTRGNPFNTAMDQGNPNVGAGDDQGADESAKDTPEAKGQAILASFRNASGKTAKKNAA